MADINLKTATEDTSLDTDAFLFGADSQSAASPSVYKVSTLKTLLLGGGSLAIASGKTLTLSNTLTLAGTDSTTMTFPSASGTVATLNAANLFTKANTFQPDSDAQAGTFRRNSSGQTSYVLEIQTEANATLAYVDKLGGIGGNSLTISGNISAPSWTTSGIRYKSVAATLTDTSAAGTVAAAYTNVYGGNTIAASNARTFTDYFTTYINSATAGANVTFTNLWALGVGGNAKITGLLSLGAASGTTGALKLSGTTSGVVTLSTADAAGTWTMKLPTSAGTNGYVLSTDGSGNTSWIAAAGGSPGGADTQVQFNDGGAFGGVSGFTFNKTTKALTLGGATITTSAPVLDLSQTWNAVGTTFTGLKFNATDTASASGSLLLDIGTGGGSYTSKFSVSKSGFLQTQAGANFLGAAGSSNAVEISSQAVSSRWFQFKSSSGSYVSYIESTVDGNIRLLDGSASKTFTLSWPATSNLQLGAADVSSGAVAQTLSVQSNTGASTTGADFSINASKGTTASGKIIFSTGPSATFGAALTLNSDKGATFGGNATLYGDAANVLVQRNAASGQKFRIYANYTDASNGSWLELDSTTGVGGFQILAKNNGTGASPSYVDVGVSATVLARHGSDFTLFNMNILFGSDNTKDIGAASASRPRNIYAASSIRASGATAVIGYGTGAGGAVTQTTSRTTGVTLNKGCGQITLVSAAGSNSWQSFTVTNSTVSATDTVIVNQDSGADVYQIFVTNVAAGSFQITYATTGGTTTEQPVFSFSVIKAVAA